MTKELASEFLEMRKEDEEIDPSCYLQPDRYVRLCSCMHICGTWSVVHGIVLSLMIHILVTGLKLLMICCV